MGIELRMFLIPRDNTFRPDGIAVARLIAWLRRDHFVRGDLIHRITQRRADDKPIEDANLAATEAGEVLAYFEGRDHLREGLQHPLVSPFVDGDEGSYYDLELRFSDDFVTTGSETVDPIDTVCRCGEQLEYWPDSRDVDVFYSSRVRLGCPRCGEAFKPQEKPASTRSAVTGEDLPPIMGGITYRFAIVVDCGKSLPTNETAEPATTAEFKRVCEAALGVVLYEVAEFH